MGLDLTFDTYPYLAGSTILGMVALPPWVQEGGIEATLERLGRPGSGPAEAEWFRPTPYPLDMTTISMVTTPTGGGPRERRSPRARSKRGRPGRLRLRDPAGVGNGGGGRRLARGRTDRGRLPHRP